MLTLTELEARETPALYTGVGYSDPHPIPGWEGPVEVVGYGDYDVFVATEGGSARVVARLAVNLTADESFPETVVFDGVVFDPAFRGGGHVTVAGGGIVVTPGAGGGPVYAFIDPAAGWTLRGTYAITGYSPTFRGDLRVQSWDVNGDGVRDLFTLPAEGGAPHLVVTDVTTNATLRSFLVGPADALGGYDFHPAGVGIQVRDSASMPDPMGMVIDGPDDTASRWTFGGVYLGD